MSFFRRPLQIIPASLRAQPRFARLGDGLPRLPVSPAARVTRVPSGEVPRADAVIRSYHRTIPAFLQAAQGISTSAKRGCAPRRCKLRILRFRLAAKAHSLRCVSSPHRTRFAGLLCGTAVAYPFFPPFLREEREAGPARARPPATLRRRSFVLARGEQTLVPPQRKLSRFLVTPAQALLSKKRRKAALFLIFSLIR